MTQYEKTFPWRALQSGMVIIQRQPHRLVVVDCGMLHLPSGRMVAADPFVTLTRRNSYYAVPPGAYPVRVTIDETIKREMYVSLMLAETAAVERRYLTPFTPDDQPYPEATEEHWYGIPVDTGTVAFVDDEAVQRGMPTDESTWLKTLFNNEGPDCWFRLMDDPTHIRWGLANIPLPLATDGANLILSHSGWGDGMYPLIGGYSDDGTLVSVHIDLLIHAQR